MKKSTLTTFKTCSYGLVVAIAGSLLVAALSTNQAIAASATTIPATSAVSSEAGLLPRTVNVSGRVTLRVVPDRATIQLQTYSTQKTPTDARTKNAASTAKVIAALKKAGVPANQISPGSFNLTRNLIDNRDGYGRGPSSSDLPKMTFTATTDITVTVTNISLANAALGEAFVAGASEGSITFETTRLRELRDEARKKAIVVAREKVELMATAAGMTVGQVVSFQEVTNSWYSPSGYSSFNAANSTQNVQAVAQPNQPALGDSFGAGPISIDAEVAIEVIVK